MDFDSIEFGDEIKVTIEDLDKLVEILNKIENLLATIFSSSSPLELFIGFVCLLFIAGFSFKFGSRLAEFITWIPVGFVSLFRREKK